MNKKALLIQLIITAVFGVITIIFKKFNLFILYLIGTDVYDAIRIALALKEGGNDSSNDEKAKIRAQIIYFSYFILLTIITIMLTKKYYYLESAKNQ